MLSVDYADHVPFSSACDVVASSALLPCLDCLERSQLKIKPDPRPGEIKSWFKQRACLYPHYLTLVSSPTPLRYYRSRWASPLVRSIVPSLWVPLDGLAKAPARLGQQFRGGGSGISSHVQVLRSIRFPLDKQ